MGDVRYFLRNIEEIVAGILMVLMSLATFSNVVARYILNSPIQWAEEFSRYASLSPCHRLPVSPFLRFSVPFFLPAPPLLRFSDQV
jgi:hypothetical protein